MRNIYCAERVLLRDNYNYLDRTGEEMYCHGSALPRQEIHQLACPVRCASQACMNVAKQTANTAAGREILEKRNREYNSLKAFVKCVY